MLLSHADIRSRFKAHGLKVTPQRAAIYQALAESTSHPTADDVYQHVARDFPMISRNTVYYTLSALKTAGLVKEVNYWHDRARFDANVAPHHHLICLGCRSIVDIESHSLNRLAHSREIPSEFQVVHHQVVFYGYCRGCRPSGRTISSNTHSLIAQPKRRMI